MKIQSSTPPETLSPASVPVSTTSGINASRYAKDRKELIGLINSMRACGVATELDLPRVAIIGNQSAGKSSLVEAISGIKVPRDAGTCTRCPFEVRLQQSDDPWNCRISIRFETGEDGRPLEKIAEIPFGKLIRDPNEVEGALRRAQLAVLNPSVSPSRWAEATAHDVKQAKEGVTVLGSKKQLSFSTNLVCIDISGPDVTDLAFLDLPGIISNVDEGEDESNIDLIKNLVKKTIDGNCLILLTLTMRDDIENQSAMKLAREADKDGKRTIGVLTKADTLQDGEHARWLKTLEGQTHRLANGYFATKLPGAADLGKNLTFEEAREAEKSFFNSTSPWSTINADLRRRLGIPKLTAYLSEKLSSYIKTKLPELRQSVAVGLRATENQISELPPPPSEDPLAELLQLLQSFRTDLDASVVGKAGHERLISEKNRIQRVFASNIKSTRPILHPFAGNDKRCDDSHALILKNSPLFEDCAGAAGQSRLCQQGTDEYAHYVVEMNLDQVRRHIEERKTRETPLNVPFPAMSSLMVETTKGWEELVHNALDALENLVLKVLAELAKKHFGRYDDSGLAAAVKDIVDAVARDLVEEARSLLANILELEKTPFTMNLPYYTATFEDVLAELKKRREERESKSDDVDIDVDYENHAAEALAGLARIGFHVQQDDLAKLLPADEFADELNVASHVLANWTVSYKRIIDNVPRIFDLCILQRLPAAVSNAFVQQLAHGGREAAQRYLSEGFEVQEQRADLQTKLARVGEAKRLLASFGRY